MLILAPDLMRHSERRLSVANCYSVPEDINTVGTRSPAGDLFGWRYEESKKHFPT